MQLSSQVCVKDPIQEKNQLICKNKSMKYDRNKLKDSH